MKTSTKRLLVVIVIVALALVVYAGSAWAQSDPTTTTPTPPTNMLQQMEQRFGPQAWAEHIQRMTQIHGADFVSQRLAWMAQQESCPGMNGEGRGMGMGMMQQRQQGMGDDMNRGMMGRGMMGRGMSARGGWWNFDWNRGPRFWNNTPTATPTAPVE
ncbi:MAG: hypothetical protein DYG89_20700 [Caldilinea sp. CFX5]|nr:hypothetical protein [Caldilinea sp. CFX5]